MGRLELIDLAREARCKGSKGVCAESEAVCAKYQVGTTVDRAPGQLACEDI